MLLIYMEYLDVFVHVRVCYIMIMYVRFHFMSNDLQEIYLNFFINLILMTSIFVLRTRCTTD